MSGIFICYRRDDSSAYAGRIYDRLSAHFGPEHVFMDVDAIRPGEDFREVIRRTCDSCEVLLAVIGRSWVTAADRRGGLRLQDESDLVRVEIASALKKGLHVIPVLVGDAEMPGPETLPTDIKELVYRNAWEISDNRFRQDVDGLVGSLEEFLAGSRGDKRLDTLTQEKRHALAPQIEDRRRLWRKPRTFVRVAFSSVIVAATIVGVWLYRDGGKPLSANDTVVFANFSNSTGDPKFEDTLKQALTVQLGQSPMLNLLSQQQIHAALKAIGRPSSTVLTPSVLRELCQESGSKAYLTGSIDGTGQYVVQLKAIECQTGKLIAKVEATASGKDEVLGALDRIASGMRRKLGESSSSVQRFSVPLGQAVTPSLAALKAYTDGSKLIALGDMTSAVPVLREATTADSNFALADSMLALAYFTLDQDELAKESARKAFDLRDRLGARDRFHIESQYYDFVTGDMEKSRGSYEQAEENYPGDVVPPSHLVAIYGILGQHEKALVESQKVMRLSPRSSTSYVNLCNSYLGLNRLDEAKAVIEEARTKKIDSSFLHILSYTIASLQGDVAGMAEQVTWSTGKPRAEGIMLSLEAENAAYAGHLRRARDFSQQAVSSSVRAEDKEQAAHYEIEAGLREGLFGNEGEAQKRAQAALTLANNRDIKYGAALVLSFANDVAVARSLADELAKQYPEDTQVQFNYLPSVRAVLSIRREEAPAAVELLRVAAPYELGSAGIDDFSLAPAYVRGEAYLAEHQGSAALVEFKKIIDHRGVAKNGPIGALAQLGLARAYALQGDTVEARLGYQDFFTMWKDADLDIPVLREAKSEYAKLH